MRVQEGKNIVPSAAKSRLIDIGILVLVIELIKRCRGVNGGCS